jgi:hypothetical protein
MAVKVVHVGTQNVGNNLCEYCKLIVRENLDRGLLTDIDLLPCEGCNLIIL